jgi:hypothetical protein
MPLDFDSPKDLPPGEKDPWPKKPKLSALRPRLALPVSDRFAKPEPLSAEMLAKARHLELKSLPVPDFIPLEKAKVFHAGVGLAESAFKEALKKIGPFLAKGGIELFSCDLGPSTAKSQSIYPVSPTLSPKKILERSKKSIDLVRRSYEGEIAAENYNYYPTGLYEHVCGPVFITEFLEKLDLSLTLDLAHAAVTAFNWKMPLFKYLEELPLERVVEIHLSKPFLPAGTDFLAQDTHLPPTKVEVAWLKQLLETLDAIQSKIEPGPRQSDPRGAAAARRRPWIVLEYYDSLQAVGDLHDKMAEYLS